MKRLAPPAAIALFLLIWYGCDFKLTRDRTGRSFDPERMAALEVELWKGYHDDNAVKIFRLDVAMLREQYDLTWSEAARVAYFFSRAASEFSSTTDGNYTLVSLKIEKGYIMLQAFTEQVYDARNVAKLELDSWIARRDPSGADTRKVAESMAYQYADLYQVHPRLLLDFAALRASAAKVRDAGGTDADWGSIANYLNDAYRSLSVAINTPPPPPKPPATPEPEPEPTYRYP